MIIERRKDMDNRKRIECMMAHFRKNEKYGVCIYQIYAIVITLLPVWLILYTSGNVKLIFGGIMIIIIYILLSKILLKKRTEGKLMIQTNLNVKEMLVWYPGGKSLYPMGKYYIVTYYVKDGVTYRFKSVIKDDQTDLCSVIMRLLNEGIVPKVDVLVDPDDYNNYIMLGYDFIERLVNTNWEMAQDELNEHYDTSEKIKYIK